MQEQHQPQKTFIRHISAGTKFIYTVPCEHKVDTKSNFSGRQNLRNLRLSYEDMQTLLNNKTGAPEKREYENNWSHFMKGYMNQNSNNNSAEEVS
ncbi:MAG: hypothetical protein MRY79_02675 [Alphaproteobacteria bacterium]|nr:hypothetical protein [Alphaproteobacteria bacterium]